MVQRLVECEPEIGGEYYADYGINQYAVIVTNFVSVAQGTGRVAVCVNKVTNTPLLLLASHLNRAIFYKVVNE